MKVTFVIFAAILLGVSSNSQGPEPRFIDGLVAEAIEDLSQQLKDDGLDPLELTEEFNYRLPVTDLAVVHAHVTDLLAVGISDIVIETNTYSLLLLRLTLQIALPRITVTIGNSEADILLLGHKFGASARGRLDLVNTRLHAVVHVTLGIGSGGIAVSRATTTLTFGTVESNLIVNALGQDYSNEVNELLRDTVPNILRANNDDINLLVAHYLVEIINENL